MKDAYYSANADYVCGYAIYLNERGVEVKVTEVVEIGTPPFSKWPDLKYIGTVDRFVESVDRLPELPSDDLSDEEFWKGAQEWAEKSLKRVRARQAENN